MALPLACALLGWPCAIHVEAQTSGPPPVTTVQDAGSLGDGYIFIGPTGVGLQNPVQGPEILDSQGRPVWFSPTPSQLDATDFRVQSYQGQPVLTYTQSPAYDATGTFTTVDYILDSTYSVVATVKAGNGLAADQHEFQLTPQNTALIPVNSVVQADLSSVGGTTSGPVIEAIVQEVDVATGTVLFQWNSLDHVPVSESHYPFTPGQTSAYDYFHINSVKLDTDGNLLISSRHTWTVYKVNRTTGAVIWRLGGKKSNYALGSGLPFAWQHDVEAVDSQTLRIFDNESDGAPVLPYSRVIWVSHDDTAMTASVVQSIVHPLSLSVYAEGSAQTLPNGNVFVDWGILGRYSEFSASGQLLLDTLMAPGYSSYRGFRYAWTGSPATSPVAQAYVNGDGSLSVHAVWNGATQVAQWQVLGGSSAGALSVVATVPWNGLDTAIPVSTPVNIVQVVALDSAGSVLGTSESLSGPFGPVFPVQPSSQTVAAGRSVAFNAVASFPAAPTYQWFLDGTPLSNGTSGGTTIAGATDSTLLISGCSAASAGTYTCVASCLGNSATSAPATLAVLESGGTAWLANLSCRSAVGSGQQALVMGFVVGGQGASGTETVSVRASGPSLAQFGLTGTLADPELDLFGPGGGAELAAAGVGVADNLTAGPLLPASASLADANIVDSLAPGAFTAVISGASGDSGIALGEVYAAPPAPSGAPAAPRLINLSGRAEVGAAGSVLIAGFVIEGTAAETVLIRASGPALAAFGVSGALADPELQLFRSEADGTSTLLSSDAGWKADPVLGAAAASVGAFSWGASATPDSSLLVTLPPGAYTVEVSGVSGDDGVALAEVYEVP